MKRSPVWVSVLVHAALLLAVCFALYPVLWVISLALSPSGTPSFRPIPLPEAVSLVNFREVAGATLRRYAHPRASRSRPRIGTTESALRSASSRKSAHACIIIARSARNSDRR